MSSRYQELTPALPQAGPPHYGKELAESAQAKAERIVAEELARRGGKLEGLVVRRKGDAAKVGMAVRLRRETTRTLAWIAARLRMGTKTYLAHLLYWEQRTPIRK
jgi:hypothetical protein